MAPFSLLTSSHRVKLAGTPPCVCHQILSSNTSLLCVVPTGINFGFYVSLNKSGLMDTLDRLGFGLAKSGFDDFVVGFDQAVKFTDRHW